MGKILLLFGNKDNGRNDFYEVLGERFLNFISFCEAEEIHQGSEDGTIKKHC